MDATWWQEIHDAEYPDVELSHMYGPTLGAMQLTRWPKQFDVIVTDNLFGDLSVPTLPRC